MTKPASIETALHQASDLLRRERVAVPEFTARLLLADVLDRNQAWLMAHSDRELAPRQHAEYAERVAARCAGVPTQYIRGKQEFYELEFRVTPEVLIPRPETEHLVAAALERLKPGDRVLDIGTGSGAIAVTLARQVPGAFVAAVDISGAAARVARSNAARLGSRVHCCVCDLGKPFADRVFDLVVSNPPYVPLKDLGGLQRELRHEPPVALFGGEDGLAVIGRLVPEAGRLLRTGGSLLMEIGFQSRPAIERIFKTDAWSTPRFHADLAGIDRVVEARCMGGSLTAGVLGQT